MKKLLHPNLINIAALAAMLLFVSCGKQLPSKAHVLSAINQATAVIALSKKPGHKLVHDQDVQSSSLYTEKFKHTVNDVEVLGSGVSYHVAESERESVTSHLADVTVSTTPGISAEEALRLGQKLSSEGVRGRPVLKILPANHTSGDRLIYQVELPSGGQLWLDARDGKHIATLNETENFGSSLKNVRTAKDQGIVLIKIPGQGPLDHPCEINGLNQSKSKVYDEAGCTKKAQDACQVLNLDLDPLSFNPGKCHSASSKDESAVRADANAQKFLAYLRDVHQRQSFDDHGSPIISVVHAGSDFANAAWFRKGKFIAYGDGDRRTFRDFTFATDIAAHEMTHALIQSTAGLVSLGESGALNESLADFFGKMVEGDKDWSFGSKVFADQSKGQALRDLLNPSRLLGEYFDVSGVILERPYPATHAEAQMVPEPCVKKNDFCGIHFNATIPGHAWYLIHEKLGSEPAQKLIYLALTHYFHEMTDFHSAAQGTLEACATFLTTAQCQDVRDVFHSTGML